MPLPVAEEPIQVERLGAVLRIWMNRPAMRNAQDRALLDALDAATQAAVEDDSVSVIVLAGRGEHFCAGHDLRELGPDYLSQPTPARYAFEERCYYDYALRLWDCPKPTIAQVQGACIAGGFMTAAMCDLMVAADDAYFTDPVVPMGSAAVEVLFHPWVLGARLAKDVLYTGRRLTAKEGASCGLVSRLVPRAELEGATLELANRIAKAPPYALKMTKRSVNRTLDIQGFRNALNAHFDTHQLVHTAPAPGVPGAAAVERFKTQLRDG